MSTVETMNIHKALTELKMLDARISRAIHEAVFLSTKKHSSDNIQGMSVEKVVENMKSAYQKASDLIERRNAIKRAVVLSNASTRVMIAGVEYTVAEAIDMKNHGLDGPTELRNVMRQQLANCKNYAERENATVDTRADTYIKEMFGNTDMTKASEEVKRSRKDFVTAQTIELVDPLNIAKVIEELDERINAFMVEVDAALSVSNATTEITIEY